MNRSTPAPPVAPPPAGGLRRAGPDVLHEQLAAELRALAQGLAERSALPSEAELMRRFRVSRTTVRRALKTLVTEGVLTRRQGVGTFVARRRVGHPLTELGGFVEAFTRHGLAVQSDLASFGWAEDPDGLPEGAPRDVGGGLVFRRVYRVDAAVWGVADCAVFEPFGSAISRADLCRTPSFDLLHKRFAGSILSSRISVGVGHPSPDVAALLDVRPDSGTLRLGRLLSGHRGRPVQYAVYHVPADRFEFTVTEPVTGEVAAVHGDELRLRLLPGFAGTPATPGKTASR